jgi:hypothetical protein
MALYEIVLSFEDRDEVRVTDRRPVVGEVLEIQGRSWEVTFERAPVDIRATARFVCERTVSRRERIPMQQENAVLRPRLRRLDDRHERARRRLQPSEQR